MSGLLHRHPHLTALPTPSVVPPLPPQTDPAAAGLAAPAAVTTPEWSGRSVLYGCFSCPWCYLANQHSDQLTDPLDRPQWRMVVPDPHLSVTGLRLDAPGRSRLQTQLAAVGAALLPGEQLPTEACGNGATTWEGSPGDLLVIPAARHDLEAVQDAVVLLTVAKLA